MFENEEWRVCAQAPDYMVSDHGRVMNRHGKIRKPDTGLRYHRYELLRKVPGKPRTPYRIAVLVLTAFKGPQPSPTHHARHLDDDFNNNMLWNLAWGTPAQNGADRRGRTATRRHPGWHEEVRRAVYLFGISKQALSRTYSCDPFQIRQICRTDLYHGIGQSV